MIVLMRKDKSHMCKQKTPEEILPFHSSTASFNKGVDPFEPQDITEDVKSMH